MNGIYVKILLDGKFLQYDNVDSIASYSSLGSFCIKHNHASMVATIRKNLVIYRNGVSVAYDIKNGFLIFKDNTATLILN